MRVYGETLVVIKPAVEHNAPSLAPGRSQPLSEFFLAAGASLKNCYEASKALSAYSSIATLSLRPLLCRTRLFSAEITRCVKMSTIPAADRNDTTMNSTPVTEGAATILFPSANEVFYNPVQQFNRDLSVLGIRAWSRKYIDDKKARLAAQQERQTKKRKTTHEAVPNAASISAASIATLEPEVVNDIVGQSGKDSAIEEPIAPNQGTAEESNGKPSGISGESTREAASKDPSTMIDSEETIPEVKFSILEALSATGLRAIRYAKEIPDLSFVTANDLSQTAVDQIRTNSEYNSTTDLVQPNLGDARVVMYTTKKKYSVVDLDPYGSAAPFLDAAVQAVEDGGLLVVTCTDLAVLAGDAHPEKCWSQYGGATIKQSEFCHEQALRMVLHTIATSAGRYGRSITPLLSLSIDFYVRLFVRVNTSPAKVKHLMSNTMLTYQCSGCGSFVNQPMGHTKPGSRPELFKYSNASLSAGKNCEQCGFTQHIGGPMFGGPLHDHAFIDQVLEYANEAEKSENNVLGTIPRIKGMLSLAREELLDPHHWSVAKLTKVLHCQSPPQQKILSAILNAGYEVSDSHTGPRCIKTNAPASFMWDMMRAWILINPIREESIKPGTAGAVILQRREPEHKIDFTFNAKSRASSQSQGLVRYQLNPTENWGPKAKATSTTRKTATQFKSTEKRKRDESEQDHI